jgi:D-arabinose 1-dehydrogenase-like Zn-dependent alcohol dehydrogenase
MSEASKTTSYKLPQPQARLVRCDEVAEATAGGEVIVEVAGCGVCHTDVHLQDGYFDLGEGKTMPLKGVPFPVSPGHEIAGRIVSKGADVSGVAIGDIVLVFPWIGCGECQNCSRQLEHLCLQPRYLGMFRDGGFSTRVRVPDAKYVIKLSGLDPVQAAPLACSGLTTYSAIRKFGPGLTKSSLILLGAGGLGLMAIRLLSALGYEPPAVLEISPSRRQAALDLGAKAAADPRDKDAVKELRKSLKGPPLYALDLVGTADSMQLAINMLGTAGHLVVVGLIGGSLNLSVPLIPLKSLLIQGSFVGSLDELRELVALAQSPHFSRAPVSTRPMGDANIALDDLRAGSVVGRIVLVPDSPLSA